MIEEKTTLINGGQNLFELNQFHFAQGRKLVQNTMNRVTVFTTRQTYSVQYEIHTIADSLHYIIQPFHAIFTQYFNMLGK